MDFWKWCKGTSWSLCTMWEHVWNSGTVVAFHLQILEICGLFKRSLWKFISEESGSFDLLHEALHFSWEEKENWEPANWYRLKDIDLWNIHLCCRWLHANFPCRQTCVCLWPLHSSPGFSNWFLCDLNSWDANKKKSRWTEAVHDKACKQLWNDLWIRWIYGL